MESRRALKSMSSWKRFDAQPSEYQDNVLPPWIWPRLSLMTSGSIEREQYVGLDSTVTGMTGYRASTPSAGYWSGLVLRRTMFTAPRYRS